VKESKELILSEYNNLEKEISSLHLFQTITENTNISVRAISYISPYERWDNGNYKSSASLFQQVAMPALTPKLDSSESM